MRKLLSADFSRLWRNKIFWIEILIMFGLGAFAVYEKYMDIVRYDTYERMEDALLVYALFAGFCSAIFSSMFLGTEYSDGTIRNKLIVGHLRGSIYLSNWLINIAAAMLMSAVYLFTYCVLGILFLNGMNMPMEMIVFYIFISFFTIVAYASIFNMLSMLITRKASATVVCMLVFLNLFILAMAIKGKLDAPEFVSGYSLTVNGLEETVPEPNPKYLQPAARRVYQFFLDILPTGQSMQLSAFEVIHPFFMMIYAVAISAATTVFGMFAFRKRI